MSVSNPVKALNPEVARKIAAGEVIDRPNAIVRELIDNSIDAGATSITVEISGGGIDKIRIVDNGCGLTKEDLQNCARPHATSKISTETDLLKLSTLGFRGEALASIAAVSRLSIISGGWKMRASITEDHILEQTAETRGSIVQSEGLFENFPARRQFLKRPATEGLMCKNTFIEKAMARPDIAFRFIQDDQVKLDLPAGQSLKDRFVLANAYSEPKELFYEIKADAGGTKPDWSFTAVIGEPAVSRTNKKEIYIYTNGRRIQEYSLVQAVEYGGQGYFPNGTYPVASVFIEINPEMVDFNIHPAKKEARFYDLAELHHGLSSTLKNFFQTYTLQNFREDKAADDIREIREEDLFSADSPEFSSSQKAFEQTSAASQPPAKAVTGTEDTETTSTTAPVYEKHISYKFNETGEASFSDYRSRYLSGGSGSSGRLGAGSGSGSAVGAGRLGAGGGSSGRLGAGGGSGTLNHSGLSFISSESLAEEALLAATENNSSASAAAYAYNESQKIRYVGKCLGTFLLAEKNNCLYLIDQHAVHERILFNSLMNNQGNRQNLLIPYKIHTESKAQDNQLEKLKDSLTKIGFETVQKAEGEWEITTIPERWTGSEYDLRTLLFVKHVEPEEIIRSIAAMTACKAAVKDGYILDDSTAAELVQKAFTLDDPHCPHGRPIYTVISRAKLFELVKRT